MDTGNVLLILANALASLFTNANLPLILLTMLLAWAIYLMAHKTK
jgi:hypothetical protein